MTVKISWSLLFACIDIRAQDLDLMLIALDSSKSCDKASQSEMSCFHATAGGTIVAEQSDPRASHKMPVSVV